MPSTTPVLPEHYHLAYHFDLQKDKKLMLLVNVLAIVILLLLLPLGQMAAPFSTLWENALLSDLLLRFGVILAGTIVYLVLHELVHGVCMKHFSGVKPHYGFTGIYAYAGSSAYFNRRHYIIIALAPVVFWGIVLAVLCALVPVEWFWCVYFIQLCNLSGAAGDFYVTVRLMLEDREILINDTGVAMTVYKAEK